MAMLTLGKDLSKGFGLIRWHALFIIESRITRQELSNKTREGVNFIDLFTDYK